MAGEMNYCEPHNKKKILITSQNQVSDALAKDIEDILTHFQGERQKNESSVERTYPIKLTFKEDLEKGCLTVKAKTDWKETIPHVREVPEVKIHPGQPDLFDKEEQSQGPQEPEGVANATVQYEDEEKPPVVEKQVSTTDSDSATSSSAVVDKQEAVSNALLDKINASEKISLEDATAYLQSKYGKSREFATLEKESPTIYSNFVNDWPRYEEKIAEFAAPNTEEDNHKEHEEDKKQEIKEPGNEEPPAVDNGDKSPDKTVFDRCPVCAPETNYQCILEAGHSGRHEISEEDKAAMAVSHPEVLERLYPDYVVTTDNMPEPPAPEEAPEICGQPHADGKRKCIKPKGHEGQHRYQ